MKFKWEMMHGSQCETYIHTLEEIEKSIDESVKAGRPEPHKPLKDFEIGEYLQGDHNWAYIERIE